MAVKFLLTTVLIFDMRASLGSTWKLIRVPSKEKGCVVIFCRPATSFIMTYTIKEIHQSYTVYSIIFFILKHI